ncbi:hypothetical protein PENSPDRAFT_672246 [Peniophora sp. CONT]|nr:hypothetical protein PENSPDRAFT_672246 [Peniophora sp. CONT]
MTPVSRSVLTSVEAFPSIHAGVFIPAVQSWHHAAARTTITRRRGHRLPACCQRLLGLLYTKSAFSQPKPAARCTQYSATPAPVMSDGCLSPTSFRPLDLRVRILSHNTVSFALSARLVRLPSRRTSSAPMSASAPPTLSAAFCECPSRATQSSELR